MNKDEKFSGPVSKKSSIQWHLSLAATWIDSSLQYNTGSAFFVDHVMDTDFNFHILSI